MSRIGLYVACTSFHQTRGLDGREQTTCTGGGGACQRIETWAERRERNTQPLDYPYVLRLHLLGGFEENASTWASHVEMPTRTKPTSTLAINRWAFAGLPSGNNLPNKCPCTRELQQVGKMKSDNLSRCFSSLPLLNDGGLIRYHLTTKKNDSNLQSKHTPSTCHLEYSFLCILPYRPHEFTVTTIIKAFHLSLKLKGIWGLAIYF